MTRLNSGISITTASLGETTIFAFASNVLILHEAYAMQGAVFKRIGSNKI